MSSDAPNAMDDTGLDRRRIDEILTLISHNRLDPDTAARLLLGVEHAPGLADTNAGLPETVQCVPETVQSLIRRFGPPPPEIEADWKEQMKAIAANWHAGGRGPLPELSLADWIVDDQNRLSLCPGLLADSDYDPLPNELAATPERAGARLSESPPGRQNGDDADRQSRVKRFPFVALAVAATILVMLAGAIAFLRIGSIKGESIAASTTAPAATTATASFGNVGATSDTPRQRDAPTSGQTSKPPQSLDSGSLVIHDQPDHQPPSAAQVDDVLGRPAAKWSLADLGFGDAAPATEENDVAEEGGASGGAEDSTEDPANPSADNLAGRSPNPSIGRDSDPIAVDQPAQSPALVDDIADGRTDTRAESPTPSDQPLAPVKISLASVESTQRWQLPNRPVPLVSPELTLEIRTPDEVTATWLRPPEPAEARKQLSLVQWTLPGESSPALRCQIECRATTRLQMRFRFAVQLDPQLPWQSVSQSQLAVALDQATTSLNRLLVDQAQWAKLYRTASTAEKRRIKPMKDEVGQSVERLQAILPSLQKLSRIVAIVDANATIHFKLTDQSIGDPPAAPDNPPVRQLILQTVAAD
jgi:hypothetical protein